MIIRQANKNDIQDISLMIFLMALELEGLYLDVDDCVNYVKRSMNHPRRARYFVAESEDAIIGCILVRPEWDGLRRRMSWWLHDLYVKKMSRGFGVGEKLVNEIISLSQKEEMETKVQLIVSSENVSAQRLYLKLGFEGDRSNLVMFKK